MEKIISAEFLIELFQSGVNIFGGGREGYPMNTNAKNHNSKSNIYILFKFI